MIPLIFIERYPESGVTCLSEARYSPEEGRERLVNSPVAGKLPDLAVVTVTDAGRKQTGSIGRYEAVRFTGGRNKRSKCSLIAIIQE